MRSTPAKSSKSNKHPFLLLAAAFSFGIWAQSLTGLHAIISIIICSVITATCLLSRSKPIATPLVITLFIFAGSTAASLEALSVSPNRIKTLIDTGQIGSGGLATIEGKADRSPEPSVDGYFVTIDADRLIKNGDTLEVSGSVRAFVPLDAEKLGVGDQVRLICGLRREDRYLVPGVRPTRQILDQIGIDATCTVRDENDLEIIKKDQTWSFMQKISDIRSRLIDRFRNELDTNTAGVLIASLLGDRYYLDKGTAETFREGGTFHILIISGLHITIIGGLALLICRLFTRNRLIHFLIVSIFLWSYSLAVGGETPVIRAALMFTLFLASYAFYQKLGALNALGIGALILLVWKPSELLGPSFQLTFISVLAIVGIAQPLLEKLSSIGNWTPSPERPFPPNVSKRLRRICETLFWRPEHWNIEKRTLIWRGGINKIPYISDKNIYRFQSLLRYLFEGIAVSTIVQLCMLPLSASYFHRVSFSSTILNLWVGLFLSIETVTAVLAAGLQSVAIWMASPFWRLTEGLNQVLLLLPRYFESQGAASIRLPDYSGFGRIVYLALFAGAILLAILIHVWQPFNISDKPLKRIKLLFVFAICSVFVSAIAITLHPFSASPPDGSLHVDLLDVGQGDSIFVTFPDGKTMLIDGGGQPDYEGDSVSFEPDRRGVGEAVVSEFLWHRGLDRIDILVSTHSDADHIQGLMDIAKNFKIAQAFIGSGSQDDEATVKLTKKLTDQQTLIQTVASGDSFDIAGVKAQILNPSPDAKGGTNNNSVVIKLIFGNRSILLTGDIEAAAEAMISTQNIASDVVKAGHHGSRTSSTPGFIAATHPQTVIISAGRRSQFGHPHREVLDRWTAAGAKIYTTGKDGTISIITNGTDIFVNTFAERQ